MMDKKQRIINFLKRNGRSSTTRIAKEIKSNVWMAEFYLAALEDEKKIIKEKETNATYWRIFNSSLDEMKGGVEDEEN